MDLPKPLVEGRLIRRYKRFLADVDLPDGTRVTAHCPNTGAMTGCAEPGARVWLSRSGNPRRKYPLTWELVEAGGSVLVGINTTRSNALVREAIECGRVAELAGYARTRGEVRFGAEGSRVDLLLEGAGGRCWVEVKSVTLAAGGGIGLFPDAVTARGARHLRELAGAAEAGERAVIFYCVQRGDVGEVRPADTIDPAYGRTLREALARGVEALAYRARVEPGRIVLESRLPVVCP